MGCLLRYRNLVLEDESLTGEGVWGEVGSDERVGLWCELGGEGRRSSGLCVLKIKNGLKLELVFSQILKVANLSIQPIYVTNYPRFLHAL